MRPFTSESFMNIKLKNNPDKIGLLAGVVLLILALGFMFYKIYNIQSQVSSINSKQNTLQTIPPSQQLTSDAAAKKSVMDALKNSKPALNQ